MSTPTPETPEDQQQPEPEQTPKSPDSSAIIAAVIVGIIVIACVGIGVSLLVGDDDDTTFRVSNVTMTTSEAGRVQVSYSVTNTGEHYGTPECTVHAEDADGFPVGSDVLTGTIGLRPRELHRYSGITGIDADTVTRVTVEC